MSDVDDWRLSRDNVVEDQVFGRNIRLAQSGQYKTKAILTVQDNEDMASVRLNVDELEALATLLLYKAKLIRENNV